MSAKTGKSIAVLKEEMSKGAISAEMVQQAFIDATSAGGKFYGMSEAGAKTINGQFSMLGDAMDNMKNTIGKAIEEPVLNAIKLATKLAECWEEVAVAIAAAVAAYGTAQVGSFITKKLQDDAIKAAVSIAAQASATGKATVAMKARVLATNALTVAQTALNAAMRLAPWALAGAAIVGIAYAIHKACTYTTEWEKSQQRINEELGRALSQQQKEKTRLDGLVASYKELKKEQAELKRIQKEQADNAEKTADATKRLATVEEQMASTKAELINLGRQYNVDLADQVENIDKGSEAYEKLTKAMEKHYKLQAYNSVMVKQKANTTEKESAANEAFDKHTTAENAEMMAKARAMMDRARAGATDLDKAIRSVIESNVNFSEQNGFFGLNDDKILASKMQQLFEKLYGKGATVDNDVLVAVAKAVYADKLERDTQATAMKNLGLTAEDIKGKPSGNGGKDEDKAKVETVETLKKELAEITKKQESLRQKLAKGENLNLVAKTEDGGDGKMTNEALLNSYKKQIDSLNGRIKAITGEQKTAKKAEKAVKEEKPIDVDAEIAKWQEEMRKVNIGGMADNTRAQQIQKEIEQVRLAYDEEIEMIAEKERRITELRKQEYKKATGKDFTGDPSTLLTDADRAAIGTARTQAAANRDKGLADATGYSQLLDKYSTFLREKAKLDQQYEEEKAALEAGGADDATLETARQQNEQRQAELAQQFAGGDSEYGAFIEEMMQQSLSQLEMTLQKAKEQLEAKRKEIEEKQKNGQPVSLEEQTALASATAKVNETEKQYNNLQKKKQAPDKATLKMWARFGNAVGDCGSELKTLGEEIGGVVGEAMQSAGDIMSSVSGMIGNIVNLVSVSTSGVENTAKAGATAIKTVETASVILAIISAAIQLTQKIMSLFGSETSEDKYERTKEMYQSYMNVLDDVIEKQLELAESLSGEAATAAYEKAAEAYQTQIEASRELAQQYLRSRGKREHSKGYQTARNIRKGLSSGDGTMTDAVRQLRSALGMNTAELNRMLDTRMQSLFELPYEDLIKLKTEAPLFFAQLDQETQDYINNIIKAEEAQKELKRQQTEQFAGISYDEMRSNFQESLFGMKEDAQSFSKTIAETLRNNIAKSITDSLFKNRLDKLMERTSAANEDDYIDAEEWASIMAESKQIEADMAEAYKQRLAMYEDADTAEATSRGFAEMSESTAAALESRFTAVYESNVRIAAGQQQYASIMERGSADILDAIKTAGALSIAIADESRSLLAQGLLELTSIREGIEALSKQNKAAINELTDIKRNTAKLA